MQNGRPTVTDGIGPILLFGAWIVFECFGDSLVGQFEILLQVIHPNTALITARHTNFFFDESARSTIKVPS